MDLMDKECPDTDRGIGCTGRMRTSGVGMSDRCGRCAQAVDSHRHTAPRDGFPDSEDKSGSRLPENQRDERRRRGNQQRQVRDQLELLRRVVVTGIARRAGEGMRMDENVSVDPVDMRKQRDTAPIPHKE